MKIKTLKLISFGKFHNKTIELNDHFNLMFGSNEAGKTTVQYFIEGMFFGFYKPYRKRKTYSEEYEHYKPRDREMYSGILIYEDEEKRLIRIERDFNKKQDGVLIFDELTGADITKEYPYDAVTRQALPLGKININSVLYNNTINIQQMSGNADEMLAKEVNDRLVSLSPDFADDISINRIKKDLMSRKDALGSVARSHSPLGEAARELASYEGILSEHEESLKRIEENKQKIRQYQRNIQAAEKKYSEYQFFKQKENKNEQNSMFNKISNLQKECTEISTQLSELEAYKDFESQTYNRLKVLQSNIDGVEERIETLDTKREALVREIEASEAKMVQLNGQVSEKSRGEIRMDYQKLRYIQEKSPLKENTEIHRPKAPKTPISIKMSPLLLGGGIILGFLAVIAALIFLSDITAIIVATMGWFILLFSVFALIIRDKGNKMAVAQPSPKKAYTPMNGLEALLTKYNVLDTEALIEHMKTAESIFIQMDKMTLEQKALSEKRDDLVSEIAHLNSQKEDYQIELETELKQVGVDYLTEYASGLQKSEAYQQMVRNYQVKNELLNELKDGHYVQTQSNEENDEPVIYITDGGEEIRVQEALIAYRDGISRLEGKNSMLAARIDTDMDVNGYIKDLKAKIKEYENDQEAINYAIDIFEDISKETHSHAAPELNQKIGHCLQKITNKYSTVKVDNQLQVKIEDPVSGRLLNINELSAGTMDQLYLALRFSVGDALELNQKMPFILDDPFVQYDFIRKSEAIKFLNTLSAGRQVLLFTCSSDEKQILDKLHYTYSGMVL